MKPVILPHGYMLQQLGRMVSGADPPGVDMVNDDLAHSQTLARMILSSAASGKEGQDIVDRL